MLNRSYIEAHKGHPHYVTDARLLALTKTRWISSEEEKRIDAMRHLTNRTKLTIYKLLYRVKELSVSDIAYVLGLQQPAVSHALADLKAAGFVEAHRCGQLICYSLV